MKEHHNRDLSDCEDELNEISLWITNHSLDSNVKYLVAYSVVKASGTLELVFKSMIHEFLSQNAIDETQDYLEKTIIDSSCNPNTGNMMRIMDSFDSRRKSIFESKLKGSSEKGDLNSLVTLRNDLAHGRSVSVSINNVIGYYNSGMNIIRLVDQVLYDCDNVI